ncbi:MAG TPA: porin family protein [Chitinophagales bacterium]|nr:porin family protein [Chitinophagales bacterium]
MLNEGSSLKLSWFRVAGSARTAPILLAVVFMLLLTVNFAIAQTDSCITNLKNANTGYDNGDYDNAILIIHTTLKNCPLSKQDQLQARKLLILCYLSIDNLEAADNTAAEIMKIDPHFKPDKFKDDPRLSSLFEKFRPEPTWAAGASGGLNIPVIVAEKTYSVVHADDATGLADYKSKTGYQFGVHIERRAFKNLWAELEVQFRNTGYSHTLDSIQNNTIHYSENLTYFDFPLSLKYYFLPGRVNPYLQGGVDFSFLTRALSTTTRNNEKDLVDRTALRNTAMAGYFGAAGIKYAVNGFGVFADVRYTYFPELVNKEGTRYADDINLYKYYYIDDDFRMDNLQINAGISYVLSYRIKRVR